MGWTNQVVQASEVVIAGGPDALYVYNGTPGPGKLLASILPVGGTDPYGNTTVAGVASYGGAGQLLAMTGGRLVFDSSGTSYLAEASSSLIQAVSSSKIWQFLLPLSDIFAQDPTAAAGTQETWKVPALLNGWANNASFGAFKYRKVSSPPNSVEVTGALSATAATNAIFYQLPTGYIPNTPNGRPTGTNTGNSGATAVAQIRWDALGNLSVASNAALPNGGTYLFGFTIPLDA